jgi:hypothetical protein
LQERREKALAVYGYVKRLPLTRRIKLRAHTAREVFDAGCGDAPDKATLLVAMLRLAQLPARIRFVSLAGEILRGVAPGLKEAARPWWRCGSWPLAAHRHLHLRSRLHGGGAATPSRPRLGVGLRHPRQRPHAVGRPGGRLPGRRARPNAT